MKILTLLFLVLCLCYIGYGKTVKLGVLKPAARITNGVKNSNNLLPQKLKDLLEPYACVYAARQVNRWLHLNNTKEFIVKYASKACNRISQTIDSLPAPAARRLCRTKISSYVHEILTLMETGSEPEQACHRMVASKRIQHRFQQMARQLKKVTFPGSPTVGPFPGDMNSTTCGLCEYLFTIIDVELQTPKEFQSLITSFKMQVCRLLSAQESQECYYFANNDLGSIIEAFIHLPPRVICFLLLDICVGPSGQQQTQLLQNIDLRVPDRCSLGPIYGCYSQEFAERCNMKDRCNKMLAGRF